MIYLDYSATTPTNEDVLNKFIENINNDNINLNEEKLKVQKLLNTDLEVIYTSGATESNNLAIKGVALKYLNNAKDYHIITTQLEHSSINEQIKYLEKLGFNIDYVGLKDGIVDIKSLEELITDKTILVSIASVNSETGLLQPINDIAKLIKKYPHAIFHSDMTQSMGKINIDLENIDLVSFTAHKFYGLKGIGCLLKNKKIDLEPIVFGDRTYNLSLIKSLTYALEKSLENLDDKYAYVFSLNNIIKNELIKYPNIKINSNENSIPHILNISVENFKPETFQHTLELYDIYISTKSACSKSNDYSKSVFALTNDLKRASTSVRISLSYYTTKKDVEKLLKVFEYLFK